MKITLISFIGLLLSANCTLAQGTGQSNPADLVVGTWLSDTRDSKIEIFRSGNTYSGRLIWANELFESDGKTSKKDTRNPDSRLQDRVLQNLIIMTNFVYDRNSWENGKIYDPDSGRTYSCSLKVKDGRLLLHAYIGVSFLGKTFIWGRVK